jgi:hypothetical protein
LSSGDPAAEADEAARDSDWGKRSSHGESLWVPKTCVTLVAAVQIAVQGSGVFRSYTVLSGM